jgi:hypothetical protein
MLGHQPLRGNHYLTHPFLSLSLYDTPARITQQAKQSKADEWAADYLLHEAAVQHTAYETPTP